MRLLSNKLSGPIILTIAFLSVAGCARQAEGAKTWESTAESLRLIAAKPEVSKQDFDEAKELYTNWRTVAGAQDRFAEPFRDVAGAAISVALTRIHTELKALPPTDRALLTSKYQTAGDFTSYDDPFGVYDIWLAEVKDLPRLREMWFQALNKQDGCTLSNGEKGGVDLISTEHLVPGSEVSRTRVVLHVSFDDAKVITTALANYHDAPSRAALK